MTYNELMNAIVESIPDDWIYDDDLGLYIYKPDVDISIISDRSWPEGNEYDDNARFHESWAEQFPDSNAYRRRFFIRYRGQIIEAFYTAMVDGARCFIPYPNLDMTMSQVKYRIGYIINTLPSSYDYDDYIRQAGITVL